MAVWIDRRKAALARARFAPKPTPKSEERAIRAQYRIDSDLERAAADEVERLLEKKEKPVEEAKVEERKKPPVAKSKKKSVGKPMAVEKKDKFEKDFYEGGED